jgi:hypothetical protein
LELQDYREDAPTEGEAVGGSYGISREEEEPPAISLHAIIGTHEPRMMRVKGTMGHDEFVFWSIVEAPITSLALPRPRNQG